MIPREIKLLDTNKLENAGNAGMVGDNMLSAFLDRVVSSDVESRTAASVKTRGAKDAVKQDRDATKKDVRERGCWGMKQM